MINLLTLLTSSITVTLPAEAQVTGMEFTLGDIAVVEGAEPGDLARLHAVRLGYVPAPGYSRLLARPWLAEEITDALPGMTVEVTGERSCRVHPAVEDLSGAQIETEAQRELTGLFEGLDAELSMQGELRDARIPKGKTPYRLNARIRERHPRPGLWSVPVEVLVDGTVYTTVWTSWSVDVWQPQPVLVRAVRRGEELFPADVQARRVRLDPALAEAALDATVLRGAVALRDLAIGSPVTARDVERQRVIRRGDIVHVEIKKGAITARATAVAQQDGRIGDRVRVVTSSTRHELVGEVMSREVVAIRMN